MGWMPTSNLWFSYLRLATPPGDLTYDLAIDTTGDNHPSTVAAAVPDGLAPGPLVDLPATDYVTPALLLVVGAFAAIVGGWLVVSLRSVSRSSYVG